jgi:hypothetical protein
MAKFLCAPPYFRKSFRIMGPAVFSRQIPSSEGVMCLVLLNHVLARRIFVWPTAARYSLCWGNDGMIGLWIARSDVTVGLWEINR